MRYYIYVKLGGIGNRVIGIVTKDREHFLQCKQYAMINQLDYIVRTV